LAEHLPKPTTECVAFRHEHETVLEGIRLSNPMKRAFAEFDSEEVPAAERRPTDHRWFKGRAG